VTGAARQSKSRLGLCDGRCGAGLILLLRDPFPGIGPSQILEGVSQKFPHHQSWCRVSFVRIAGSGLPEVRLWVKLGRSPDPAECLLMPVARAKAAIPLSAQSGHFAARFDRPLKAHRRPISCWLAAHWHASLARFGSQSHFIWQNWRTGVVQADGPLLARLFWQCSDQIACVHRVAVNFFLSARNL
jgi:hypothetical protein